MFDRHQVVRTRGVWREAFQPIRPMLDATSELQRDEPIQLFAELANGQTCAAAGSTLKAHATRLPVHANCDRDVTNR